MDAKVAAIVVVFITYVLMVTLGPIFTIWSLNYLFNSHIPINFYSWCAVLWLMAVLHGARRNKD